MINEKTTLQLGSWSSPENNHWLCHFMHSMFPSIFDLFGRDDYRPKIYFIEPLPTLGPKKDEKWRFYTPKIWIITPKNKGCGFPW